MSQRSDIHVILKVLSGSRAYGLDMPNSDTDSRAVCIPSKRHVLGLHPYEQEQDERGDNVIYGIHKFIRLALEGNPNIVELVFTEDVIFVDSFGERLRSLRQRFLSQRVAERFGNYALHQLHRMENHHRWWKEPPLCPTLEDVGARFNQDGKAVFPSAQARREYEQAQKQWTHYQRWRAERNPARAELEQKFGYDTKHAMHLCRLLKMGLEILRDGVVVVKRPDAEWLKGVRQGSFTYEGLLEWARGQERCLQELQASSFLPAEPDSAFVESALISILEEFYWPR